MVFDTLTLPKAVPGLLSSLIRSCYLFVRGLGRAFLFMSVCR